MFRAIKSAFASSPSPALPAPALVDDCQALGDEDVGLRCLILLSFRQDGQTAALVAVPPAKASGTARRRATAFFVAAPRAGDASGPAVPRALDSGTVDWEIAPSLAPYAHALGWFLRGLARDRTVQKGDRWMGSTAAKYASVHSVYSRTAPVKPGAFPPHIQRALEFTQNGLYNLFWNSDHCEDLRAVWIGEHELVSLLHTALAQRAARRVTPLAGDLASLAGAACGFKLWHAYCTDALQWACIGARPDEDGTVPEPERLIEAAKALGVEIPTDARLDHGRLCAILAPAAIEQLCTVVYGAKPARLAHKSMSAATRGGILFGEESSGFSNLATRWDYRRWRRLCAEGVSGHLSFSDAEIAVRYVNGRRAGIDQDQVMACIKEAEAEGGHEIADWEAWAPLMDIAMDIGAQLAPADIARPWRLCAVLAFAMCSR
ncbi:hypothetical protein TW95_gp0108 [Pandoravirus inopinatum]|uniref:Uncharacterized protein n=1 Tax=Pandoravirus inopinatum TaxID=1605721 RepID=A0A0B5JBA7_9VIRU|nr:hypothetical protein TW95_gp0108 [Pandoravirus inopinatum]AJF96842.1 hypothetical protein [Pandoravirus inopinatum]